jgi:hypothetical protein
MHSNQFCLFVLPRCALQEELTSAAQQAQGIERTMREITTINQMISTAVMQQAEMIETLYNNAVDATQVRGSHALVRLLWGTMHMLAVLSEATGRFYRHFLYPPCHSTRTVIKLACWLC